jgi:hypothetical protein
MTRLNRALLVLLALQVVALVALRLGGRGPERPKLRKLFAQLKPLDVTRLRVAGEDGKKSVLLEKQAGKWVLASGGGYPALENKVSELLGKLAAVQAGAPVSEKPDHHRALEVGKEGYQRELTVEPGPGGKPLRLYLGSSAGLKDVHLRVDGESTVYLVKDLSPWDAGTAAADWVSTDYFKAERDRIVALTVENAQGKLELTKGEGGKWTVAGLAEEAKVKQSEVDSLLGVASAVALQEPVGTKLEAKHGLEKPSATLTVEVEEKKGEEKKGEVKRSRLVLRVGAKEGEAYYAKSDGSPFVVKVGAWSVEPLLKKKAADLEEKKDDAKKDEQKDDAPPPADVP